MIWVALRKHYRARKSASSYIFTFQETTHLSLYGYSIFKHHLFRMYCMGKICCMEYQRVPLKIHTKYLTRALKDTIFIDVENLRPLRFTSSYVFLKRSLGLCLPRGRISSACATSMWIKCKYMYILFLKYPARKGLKHRKPGHADSRRSFGDFRGGRCLLNPRRP